MVSRNFDNKTTLFYSILKEFFDVPFGYCIDLF